MFFILRYTNALEILTDTTIPASSSHGDVPKCLSAHRPTSANTTIGIVMVYPNSHAICHALKFAKSPLIPLTKGGSFGGLLSGVPLASEAGAVSCFSLSSTPCSIANKVSVAKCLT